MGLIPAPTAHAYDAGVAVCDGTGMAPFTVHVAATGAWTESEWLEVQEARAHR